MTQGLFWFGLAVKFVIMPEGHVMSMNCSLHQSVLELRAHFSTELQQPPEMILMLFDGNSLRLTVVVMVKST